MNTYYLRTIAAHYDEMIAIGKVLGAITEVDGIITATQGGCWDFIGPIHVPTGETTETEMGPQPVMEPFRGETLPSSMTLTLTFLWGSLGIEAMFAGTWALGYDRGCWHPGASPGRGIPYVVFSTEPGTLPRLVVQEPCGGGGEADRPGGRPMTWTGVRLICNSQEGFFNAVLSF